MLAKLEQHRSALGAAEAGRIRHVLMVLPKVDKPAELKNVPYFNLLQATLDRRKKPLADLRKSYRVQVQATLQ